MFSNTFVFQAEEFEGLGETLSPEDVAAEYAKADIKSSTFTSTDILEEHSKQLKRQVIVFVKKHLKALEVEMQHVRFL